MGVGKLRREIIIRRHKIFKRPIEIAAVGLGKKTETGMDRGL